MKSAVNLMYGPMKLAIVTVSGSTVVLPGDVPLPVVPFPGAAVVFAGTTVTLDAVVAAAAAVVSVKVLAVVVGLAGGACT